MLENYTGSETVLRSGGWTADEGKALLKSVRSSLCAAASFIHNRPLSLVPVKAIAMNKRHGAKPLPANALY